MDEHAESLTDLIDVLQRQSFTRRFEVPTNEPVAERTTAPGEGRAGRSG